MDWEIHDCPNCPASGNCELEHLAPILNEHITSINQATQSELGLLQMTVNLFCKESPAARLCVREILQVACACFQWGYAKALEPIET